MLFPKNEVLSPNLKNLGKGQGDREQKGKFETGVEKGDKIELKSNETLEPCC